MIDLKQMKQWRDGCGFKHRLLSQSSTVEKENSTPKESTILKVFQCIRMHRVITKKVIVNKTRVSVITVGKCLDVLLDRREIERNFITKRGPHSVYNYKVIAQYCGGS